MPTIQQIIDRKKEVSGQVSSQMRTLALGLLAISWALLTAHDDPLKTMAQQVNHYLILAVAICAVLVITCDLLQYVCATSYTQDALKRAEKANPKEAQFNDKSFAYKAHEFFYHAKFVLLTIGAVLLAIIFFFLFRASV